MSRIKNTTRNVIFAFFRFGFNLLAQFALRTVFIYTLGSRYLGLDSLFLNIVYVLSITELGIGAAIGYSMYKPAADGDVEKLTSLNALFRKVYRFITLIILALGVMIMPFVHHLVGDGAPDGVNIYIAFLAFLFTTLISFLAAHKRTLLFVYQRNDVVSKISTLGIAVTKGAQIAILLLTHSYLSPDVQYYIYLAIMPLGMLVDCFLALYIAKKLYPQISGKAKQLSKDDKKTIVKNIASLGLHRLSSIIIGSLATILISVYFGLEILGLSANYILVFTSIAAVIEILTSSVQGSIGNMIASDTVENNHKMFKMLNLGFYLVVGFCSVCLFVLYQPFIVFWINDEWLLPTVFMVSMVVRFYFTQITQLVFTYRTCSGLMWNDRLVPIISIPLNVGLSILFIHLFGLSGVFFGIAVTAIIAVVVTPYILYKHYFKQSVRGYYINFLVFTAVTVIIAGVTFLLCSLLPYGFLFLGLRLLICCVVAGVVYLAIFGSTKEFKLLMSYGRRILKRRVTQTQNKQISNEVAVDSVANE